MTREELNRPLRLEQKIKAKETMIEGLRASLLPRAIRYDADKVQTSPSDITLEIMAEIDELERELQKLMDQRLMSVRMVSTAIRKIDDPICAEVMAARYIRGRKYEQIAEDMGFSERWVYNTIRKGVKKIGRTR